MFSACHALVLQGRDQGLHHGRRPAQVKLVAPEGQGAAQERDIEPALMLVVPPELVVRAGRRVADMQMQLGVAELQGLQVRLHDVLGAVAHPVEEPDLPRVRPVGQGVQDGQQRGDPDAAGDQHDG